MSKEAILGTWKLVEAQLSDKNGEPLMIAESGQLIYTEDGSMSVHIRFTPGGHNAANYLAYYGSFKVSDEGFSVRHRVADSSADELIGKRLDRDFQLEGNRLVSYATVGLPDGDQRRVPVIWERLG